MHTDFEEPQHYSLALKRPREMRYLSLLMSILPARGRSPRLSCEVPPARHSGNRMCTQPGLEGPLRTIVSLTRYIALAHASGHTSPLTALASAVPSAARRGVGRVEVGVSGDGKFCEEVDGASWQVSPFELLHAEL